MPETAPENYQSANKAIDFFSFLNRLEFILLRLAEIRKELEEQGDSASQLKVFVMRGVINPADPTLGPNFGNEFFVTYPLSGNAKSNQGYQDIVFEELVKYFEFLKQEDEARFLQFILPNEDGVFTSEVLENINLLAHRMYHGFNDFEVEQIIEQKKAELDPNAPDYQARLAKLEDDLAKLEKGQLILAKGKSGQFDTYVSAQEIKVAIEKGEPLEGCWFEDGYYSYCPEPSVEDLNTHVPLSAATLAEYVPLTIELTVEGEPISLENLLTQGEAQQITHVIIQLEEQQLIVIDYEFDAENQIFRGDAENAQGKLVKFEIELNKEGKPQMKIIPEAGKISLEPSAVLTEPGSEILETTPLETLPEGKQAIAGPEKPTETVSVSPSSPLPRYTEEPFTPPKTNKPIEQTRANATDAAERLQGEDPSEEASSPIKTKQDLKEKRKNAAEATGSDPNQTLPEKEADQTGPQAPGQKAPEGGAAPKPGGLNLKKIITGSAIAGGIGFGGLLGGGIDKFTG